jgi:predicted ABC-type ATPase
VSRLDLVVGPNGAGKSTFVRLVLAAEWPSSTFVNADEIAAQRWPEDPMAHAYDAAALAEQTRQRLIELGRPFIAETVFSHPSKLDLMRRARAAGYDVALHVLLVPEELSVARVHYRVAAGGHDVPVEKIRGRYARLWANVVEGIALADMADVWDNSSSNEPEMVALFSDGVTVGNPRWPTWTPVELSKRWPAPE